MFFTVLMKLEVISFLINTNYGLNLCHFKNVILRSIDELSIDIKIQNEREHFSTLVSIPY